MATNRDMIKANRDKKDEFYTQLSDIEKEMKYYLYYVLQYRYYGISINRKSGSFTLLSDL